MSEPLPNVTALRHAFKAKLESNNELLDLIFDRTAWNGVPGFVDWLLPVLEWGIQEDTDDPSNGYGQNGVQYLFRVMVHDRGDEPGLWDYDRSYEALALAHEALTDTPLVVGDGQKVWYLRRQSGIPETPQLDSNTGYVHTSVGALYRLRVYKKAS